MQIRCRYVSTAPQNRKYPYEFGKVYTVVINGNRVFNEMHDFDTPIMTIEEFLSEFLPLKPGD